MQKAIETHYGIKVVTIETIKEDKVYLLHTETQKYVLRKLNSEEQGKTEAKVFTALKDQGLCPDLIMTRDGKTMSFIHGSAYNLQTFISGQSVTMTIEHCYRLGVLMAKLGLAFTHVEGVVENPNQFALNDAYMELKETQQDRYGKILEHMQRVMAHESIKNVYVHGDMTNSNLLYDGESFYIIDYGEVRLGHRYFDLAAMIHQVNAFISTDDREEGLFAFIKGYESQAGPIDMSELLKMIDLWGMRGVAALLIHVNQELVVNRHYLQHLSLLRLMKDLRKMR